MPMRPAGYKKVDRLVGYVLLHLDEVGRHGKVSIVPDSISGQLIWKDRDDIAWRMSRKERPGHSDYVLGKIIAEL